jgi:hypothetical protein
MTTETVEKTDETQLITIRNLNVNDIIKVSKIGKSTQSFKDDKLDAILTAELLLLKAKIGKRNIVLKLYGNSKGTNVEGEEIEKKPTVAYSELENYIYDNKLDLPISVDLSLTIIEDGKGQNTYKHFAELANHIDLNEAFGE